MTDEEYLQLTILVLAILLVAFIIIAIIFINLWYVAKTQLKMIINNRRTSSINTSVKPTISNKPLPPIPKENFDYHVYEPPTETVIKPKNKLDTNDFASIKLIENKYERSPVKSKSSHIENIYDFGKTVYDRLDEKTLIEEQKHDPATILSKCTTLNPSISESRYYKPALLPKPILDHYKKSTK